MNSIKETVRLDKLMLDRGLVPSRTKAKELIETGVVQIKLANQWICAKSASSGVESEVEIRVTDHELLRFVSRSGLKLDRALERLSLSVKNLLVLDIGISTGGFSDCLLQRGAKHVIGVDVGHGQVDASLKNHQRLEVFEGVNGRSLADHPYFSESTKPEFDLIVMDVSFISMTLILPSLLSFLSKKGRLLSLVKPQFELDSKSLNKKGIVKEMSSYKKVEEKVMQACQDNGLAVIDYFESGFPGRDGNLEYFVYGERLQ